jgi:hypothetical protein
MARKRKTVAERRQEDYEADRRAWDLFIPKLNSVQSLKDAIMLHHESIGPDKPGRKHYANLGFFLNTFAAPDGANATELAEYLRLIERFDAEGVLKTGARAAIEQALRDAMRRRAW